MEILEEILNLDTNIEVNENLCFNTALFEACKKSPHINNILNGYGKAVSEYPVLIDIRQIHDLSSITDIHGNVYPRGFQTRAAEDLDRDTVEEIAKDMCDKNWDPSLMQGAVFRLPKEFKGMSYSSDGVERIYGIGNLTHRLYSARLASQTHILAWIIDISLSKLRKWATAEANRKRYASNPRNDLIDITESILFDLSDKNSDISVAIASAATPEKEENAIREEVESYHVHSKTRDAIIRRLGHKGGFTPERKKYDADFMKEYVEFTFQEWVTSSSDIYDYISNNDVPAILSQDEGRGASEVATKWAQHVLNDNGPLKVLFSLKKSGKINAKQANEIRRMFIQKVGDYMKMMGEAYHKIYIENTGTLPMYEAFPEFANETKMIKMY